MGGGHETIGSDLIAVFEAMLDVRVTLGSHCQAGQFGRGSAGALDGALARDQVGLRYGRAPCAFSTTSRRSTS